MDQLKPGKTSIVITDLIVARSILLYFIVFHMLLKACQKLGISSEGWNEGQKNFSAVSMTIMSFFTYFK